MYRSNGLRLSQGQDAENIACRCVTEVSAKKETEVTVRVLRGLANIRHASASVRSRMKRIISRLVDAQISQIFDKIPLRTANRRKLKEICLLSYVKARFSGVSSGVVFAGFGREEVFPSVIAYTVESSFGGYLKHVYLPDESTKIDSQNTAAMVPYAQREMVDTFMGGIDPSLRKLIETYVSALFGELPDKLINRLAAGNKPLLKELKRAAGLLVDDFNKKVRNHQRQGFINPVLEAVDALPIADLALMAEALVNLTSFKRKVTMVPESVGGDIDVAVISKGDGFIWIKRKHYFKPELNHHFITNYFHGDR